MCLLNLGTCDGKLSNQSDDPKSDDDPKPDNPEIR